MDNAPEGGKFVFVHLKPDLGLDPLKIGQAQVVKNQAQA